MSEYNEDAYRDARKSVNPSPCAFEQGVLGPHICPCEEL